MKEARTLTVAVCDDELIARRRLERLLSDVPFARLVGVFDSAEAALAAITAAGSACPDVLLLDIHMPGLSGVEAAARLPAGRPHVVYCTAHKEHAVDAFEQGAVDYLLKPIAAERLLLALERARDRAAEPPADPQPAVAVQRLAIPTRRGVVLVDPVDITHAAIEGELVAIHTATERWLTDFTLGELERRLPADRFVRVHRRALLNLAAVARLEPLDTGGYRAHTLAGEAVTVSRQSARRLRRQLGL